MKNKKHLSLRSKIFIDFLICSICIVILIRNLDAFYYEYLINWFDHDLWGRLGWVYMLMSFVIQFGAAFAFYRMTGRALKKETERRVREQNLIYAAIAHDLKTPMTSVQGFAKALSDGKVRPEEQQEVFDIIYRKSRSCDEMVNTLFEYSKLGTDGYKPELAETDVCALVRDIIAESYCDFEDNGIELNIDIPDEAIMINADRSELKRAVTNLIVNVYKHNPSNIRARISVAEESGRAEIRIADSGDPLPEGVYIFEPFVTENTARTVGRGTGLGLAVTKRVIERHGGEVKVRPAADGYTKEFVIRL